MKCMHQKGFVTLLITSVLLVCALIVSLGYSRSVFHQLKVAQNEVAARQSHWRAEGGLECYYSKVKQANSLPTTVTDCEAQGVDSITTSLAGNHNTVQSQSGSVVVSKTVVVPTSRASGAIQSTSNLLFHSTFESTPDPTKNSASGWECTVIRYNLDLKFLSLHNKGFVSTVPPYAGFPSGQSCHSDYSTFHTSTLPALENDFQQDLFQTPFLDLFQVPREEWFDIMEAEYVGRVPSTLEDADGALGVERREDLPYPSYVTNCEQQIRDQIADNKKNIVWVYGGCEFTDTGVQNINTAVANLPLEQQGLIVVVHNGILSSVGGVSFEGMLYHLITDSSTLSVSDWALTGNEVELYSLIDYTPDLYPTVSVSDVSYYQRGSFHPKGGFIMDAPSTYAVFGGALDLIYNRDMIENPIKHFNKYRWLRGSWNDF